MMHSGCSMPVIQNDGGVPRARAHQRFSCSAVACDIAPPAQSGTLSRLGWHGGWKMQSPVLATTADPSRTQRRIMIATGPGASGDGPSRSSLQATPRRTIEAR
eukprot:240743-Rhodomonas_salina.2